MKDDFWRWDAAAIAGAVRTRAISAREAVAAALARLDAVNPRINAVVDILGDEALAAADAADAAVKRGDALGPLHGVPVTIKVNIDQRGRATTNGVVAFKDVVAEEDSPPVANWRKAGAIVIGRTNTPAFSWRWFTDNALHGATKNPWDAGRTPGGSSGGAAAALAAGIGALAHGNDYGGSIRYPAYACGLVGIRPSFGRVPTYNGTAPEERPLAGQIISAQGPLARRVADLRLGLAAMAARDPRDPWWVPAPFDGPPVARPIRVAMSVDPGGLGVDPAIADAVRRAASWLAEAGYRVEEVEPPRFNEATALWAALTDADMGPVMGPLIERHGDAAIKRAAGLLRDPDAVPLDFAGYRKALAQRATLLREWLLFLETHPIVLMPVSTELPFPAGLDQQEGVGRRLLAAQRPMLGTALLGIPGIAVPTGLSAGVPVGVQILAGRFREDLCLDAAAVVEARAALPVPIDPR